MAMLHSTSDNRAMALVRYRRDANAKIDECFGLVTARPKNCEKNKYCDPVHSPGRFLELI